MSPTCQATRGAPIDRNGAPHSHAAADIKKLYRRIVLIFRGGPLAYINRRLSWMDAPRLMLDVAKLSHLGFPEATTGVLPAVRNASWMWSAALVGSPAYYRVTDNHWKSYYPGDGYVDWVGCDPYSFGGDREDELIREVDIVHDFARKSGKLMAFPKWGLAPDGADDESFVRPLAGGCSRTRSSGSSRTSRWCRARATSECASARGRSLPGER